MMWQLVSSKSRFRKYKPVSNLCKRKRRKMLLGLLMNPESPISSYLFQLKLKGLSLFPAKFMISSNNPKNLFRILGIKPKP